MKKIFKKSALITTFSAIIGSLVLSACATTSEDLGFHVTSTSMDTNHIFNKTVSLGSNVSPQLTWSKNAQAQGYAILMIDKDAAGTIGVPFAHWFAVVKDANTTNMPEGASNLWSATSSPMKDKFFQFQNMTTKKVTNSIIPADFQKNNAQTYFGPMPPDKDHLYEIQVIALKDPQAFPTDQNATTFVDFQQYVARSQPAGIASLFGVGRQYKEVTVSGKKTFEFVNPEGNPNEKTIQNGQFYKTLADASKRITKFKSSALITEDGKPPLLPDEYVSMLSNTGTSATAEKVNSRVVKRQADGTTTTTPVAAKFSATDSPELSWDRYEGAKSYALFLNNSNQYEKWGAPVVNWVVWNIAQPATGTTVTLVKGASKATDKKINQGWNSYNSGKLGSGSISLLNTIKLNDSSSGSESVPKSRADTSEKNEEVVGAFLKQATGLGQQYFLPYHDGTTHHKGFYSFFLYALDVEGSQLSSSIKTQQDLMQAMNGHVLAISQLNFKLQKTAPSTAAATTA